MHYLKLYQTLQTRFVPGYTIFLFPVGGAASLDCPLSPLKTNLPIERGSQSCLGDLDNSTSEPLEDSVKSNGEISILVILTFVPLSH